jgi:predicted transglutaminase-like cysteine proteinase
VQISTLESKVAGYVVQVAGLQTQVSNLQANVTSLQSEKTALNTRLTNVLKTTVIQHYDWLNTYTWELPIPLSLYFEYKEKPRPSTTSTYASLATDAKDDDCLDQMIQFVNDKARQYSFNEQQKINFVIAFVQSLPYTVDSVTTSADEYPRYPIETLFDRGGDCEDTAILTAALLDKMGYDVALLHLSEAHHMATGISIPALSLPYQCWYYDHNGKKYYYIETTGEGWRIGQMPSEYTSAKAYVYPLKK